MEPLNVLSRSFIVFIAGEGGKYLHSGGFQNLLDGSTRVAPLNICDQQISLLIVGKRNYLCIIDLTLVTYRAHQTCFFLMAIKSNILFNELGFNSNGCQIYERFDLKNACPNSHICIEITNHLKQTKIIRPTFLHH